VVHPEFIESLDFFPANAPTRYGRISGGVVAAQVARARDDRVHVSIAADGSGTLPDHATARGLERCRITPLPAASLAGVY